MMELGVVPKSPWRQNGVYLMFSSVHSRNVISFVPLKPRGSRQGAVGLDCPLMLVPADP